MKNILLTVQVLDGVGDWRYFTRVQALLKKQCPDMNVYYLVAIPAGNRQAVHAFDQWRVHNHGAQGQNGLVFLVEHSIIRNIPEFRMTPARQLRELKNLIAINPHPDLVRKLQEMQKNDAYVEDVQRRMAPFLSPMQAAEEFIAKFCGMGIALDGVVQISVPFESEYFMDLMDQLPTQRITVHEIFGGNDIKHDPGHVFFGLHPDKCVGLLGPAAHTHKTHELFEQIFSSKSLMVAPQGSTGRVRQRSFNMGYIQSPAHAAIFLTALVINAPLEGADFYLPSCAIDMKFLRSILLSMKLIDSPNELALITPEIAECPSAKVRIFSGFKLDDDQYQTLAAQSHTLRAGSGDNSIVDALCSPQVPFISSLSPFKISFLHDLMAMCPDKSILFEYLGFLKNRVCSLPRWVQYHKVHEYGKCAEDFAVLIKNPQLQKQWLDLRVDIQKRLLSGQELVKIIVQQLAPAATNQKKQADGAKEIKSLSLSESKRLSR